MTKICYGDREEPDITWYIENIATVIKLSKSSDG